jgi:quercetin dioxygenase-like cupin family protein
MTRTTVVQWDAIPLEKITEMIARKTIVAGRQTIIQSYLKRGTLVPRHVHSGDQVILVLQGTLRVVVADDDVTVRESEVLSVPAGVPHEAEALDDTFVMDIRTA